MTCKHQILIDADEYYQMCADAARYRWLKIQPALTLEFIPQHCGSWKHADGTWFVPTHLLTANGTQHKVCASLDETIDEAMKS